MSAMRTGAVFVTFVLIGASDLSASPTGALAGSVRDALSGEPLVGAVVMLGGNTSYGAVVGVKGNYLIPTLPETAGTVIGADIGYDAISVPYSAAAGCTTHMDFYLYRTPVTNLSQSQLAESLLRSRGIETIYVDTVAVPLSTNDRSAMSRSNRVRRALLDHYDRGKGYRAAMTLETWRPFPRVLRDPVPGRGDPKGPVPVQMGKRASTPIVAPQGPYPLRPYAMVATGKGLCFYRKYNPRGEAHAGWSQATYQAESLTAGYFSTEPNGKPDFIPCGNRFPQDKWLVLRLTLLSGGTVFF